MLFLPHGSRGIATPSQLMLLLPLLLFFSPPQQQQHNQRQESEEKRRVDAVSVPSIYENPSLSTLTFE